MSGWGTQAVYATKGGRAFHQSEDCRALLSAQDLNDWDCGCDEYCRHRSPQLHAVRTTTFPGAMGDGKLPCLVCMPGLSASWFRTPCEDDFGHVPVRGWGGDVCDRCTHLYTAEWIDEREDLRTDTYRVPMPWPCTSALVLGLVPRPGVCPGCGDPMDPPPPGSTKCPPCDDNERIDALGTAL